jgi:hypothetical protein
MLVGYGSSMSLSNRVETSTVRKLDQEFGKENLISHQLATVIIGRTNSIRKLKMGKLPRE